MSALSLPHRATPIDAHGPIAVALLADRIGISRMRALLAETPFQIVACADTVGGLIDTTADVVILCGGADLLARGGVLQSLRAELPEALVVFVATGEDRATVRKAIRAGAEGYVPAARLEEALDATIRAVVSGQVCVPRSVRQRALYTAFSFRELQVLELVAMGLTNCEIGDRLFLSESTVKSHLSSSFRKLGVSSRAEAAAIVLDPDNGFHTGLRVAPLGREEPEAGPSGPIHPNFAH